MLNEVSISICIPTYKNPKAVKKLLDSIKKQTFKAINVFVTDDSPDTSISDVCDMFSSDFDLFYHKNEMALGSPENWNKCISLANGRYIKIMHHDDYFLNAGSLQNMYELMENSNADVGFCWSTDFYNNKTVKHELSYKQFLELKKKSQKIFSGNFIGAPSVMIIKNNVKEFFDKNLKWLVDIDYYYQLFKKYKIISIESNEIGISISETQITNDCINNIDVDLKEWLYLYKKYRVANLLKNRFLLKTIAKKIYYYRNNESAVPLLRSNAAFFEIFLLNFIIRIYCVLRRKPFGNN